MSETTRNRRKQLSGEVVSISGSKSIKVAFNYKIPHPLYKKRDQAQIHLSCSRRIW